VWVGLLLLWAAQGVIGQVAVEAIKATVTPSPLRDVVLLAIWPIVIVAGAAVAVAWIWRQPTQTNPSTAAPIRRRPPTASTALPATPVSIPSPQPVREREFVPPDVTVDYLASQFDGRTGIQAAKLVSVYLGKWMRVTGPLGNVGAGPEPYQVTFAGYNNRTYMYFRDPRAVERLSMLTLGTEIVVVGQITQIRASWVDLADCELISP
jgi:hypothetical protein